MALIAVSPSGANGQNNDCESVAVSSSLNPSFYGMPVTLTATITVQGTFDNGGTVSFKANGTAISTCQNLAVASSKSQCTVSTLPVGTDSIVATYSGDTKFKSATSPCFDQYVYKTLTVTGVSASVLPATYGGTIVYTATVSGGDDGGTVSFTDNGSPISNCQGLHLTNFQATCTKLAGSLGTDDIVATYTGDANTTGSTSNTFVETTDQAPTSTTVNSSLQPASYGSSVNITATVTGSDGGGTVSFTDNSVTMSGCHTVSLTAGKAVCSFTATTLGANDIVATYSGDTDYAGSTSATFDEIVDPASTATVLSASLIPATYGQDETLTATVTGSDGNGTVGFSDNSGPIADCTAVALTAGKAQCTFEVSGLGANLVEAVYTGDAHYAGSDSNELNISVNQDPSTTVLTTSASPAPWGTSVTYTATVSGGDEGGTVSFSDNSTPIATCQGVSTTDGVATCTLTTEGVGTHTIGASYTGDTTTAGSTATPISEVISVDSTGTSIATSLNPAPFGASITFTATVTGSDGGGSVTFSDTNNAGPIPNCSDESLSAGTATCTVTASAIGTDTVTATYSGDTDFGGSASDPLAEVEVAAPTGVVLSATVNPVAYEGTVTISATVSGSDGGGTVDFGDSNNAGPIPTCQGVALVAGVATCQLTATTIGTDTITATYSGDTDYAGSSAAPFDEVTAPAPTMTTLASSASPVEYGTSVTFTATVFGSDGGGTVSFSDNDVPIGDCQDLTLSSGSAQCVEAALAVGTHSIVASYSGDTDYAASASQMVNEVVNQAITDTVLVSSAEPSFYGSTVTFTASVGPSDGGGKISFTSNGSPVAGCQNLSLSGDAAKCTFSTMVVGAYTLVATYSGDTDYAGSTSLTFNQTVLRAYLPMLATATPASAPAGTAIRLGVHNMPSNANGTVVFTFGKIFLCSGTVTGGTGSCLTSTTLPKGTYNVTARYSGNADYAVETKHTQFILT